MQNDESEAGVPTISTNVADDRVAGVRFGDERLIIDLADGRAIAVPVAWYPRLAKATPAERENWEVAGAGYGIHWPDVDEDLSTNGLLRGIPAPKRAA
jgi:hypothetical protein